MNLTVNGKPAAVENADSLNITTLLTELKVQTPEYVTVELNGEILNREEFPATMVKEGDSIEFLYFMGGGA